MTANPKLTKEQAQAQARNRKGREAFSKYYPSWCRDRHLRKLAENFPKTAAIHKRLQAKPKKGNIYWILNDEVRDDIDPNDKALVLATYDGGTFTVKDWFEALCDIAPPGQAQGSRHPRGRGAVPGSFAAKTAAGGRGRGPGLGQGPGVDQGPRERRRTTWSLAMPDRRRLKGLAEPNDQDVAASYEKVKDTYARNDRLKLA